MRILFREYGSNSVAVAEIDYATWSSDVYMELFEVNDIADREALEEREDKMEFAAGQLGMQCGIYATVLSVEEKDAIEIVLTDIDKEIAEKRIIAAAKTGILDCHDLIGEVYK